MFDTRHTRPQGRYTSGTRKHKNPRQGQLAPRVKKVHAELSRQSTPMITNGTGTFNRGSAGAVGGSSPLRIPGVAFVVLAALAVHAAGGLQNVLRVEAAQRAGLQYLIHRVIGDHHPLRRVRHR